MSIRLVAVDVDPEEGVMLRSDFTLLCRYIGLHHFLFSFLPDTKAHVRYDLVALTCTIRSCGCCLYDMILRIVLYDMISQLLRVQYLSQSHTYYNT